MKGLYNIFSITYSSVSHLPFRVLLRFSFVRASMDLTVDMYRVLFLPSIVVTTPGDFN